LHTRGTTMNRRIVIAIDADLSPYTQHMLCVASSLLERTIPHLGAVLLHVIPVPELPRSKFSTARIAPTAGQRELAEQALHRVRLALQQQCIVPERIELLLRSGTPPDEIVKAAGELEADFIMIGSRGNSLKQKVRRVFTGSTSRQVIKLGTCPVMVVSLPPIPGPDNLVAWYQEAITHSLHEHPGQLVIFTASETAHLFAPAQSTVGRKEVAAASAALKQLARSGVLVCQRVNGELRCSND
jgi:nucleotide-binding universal stress UspA family protein